MRKLSRSMSDPNAVFKIPKFLRNFKTFECNFTEDDEIKTIKTPSAMPAEISNASPKPMPPKFQEASESSGSAFTLNSKLYFENPMHTEQPASPIELDVLFKAKSSSSDATPAPNNAMMSVDQTRKDSKSSNPALLH